jgi:penicillin-binding protein 1B
VATALVAALASFAMQVDALRALRATGPSWSFPSRVFSDGVPLLAERRWPMGYLLDELVARQYMRTSRPIPSPGTYWRTASQMVIALRGFRDGADPEGRGGPETVRLGFDGGMLARVERLGSVPGAQPPDLDHPPRLEPALVSFVLGPDRVRRSYVTLDRVPRTVQDAVVASEDRRFYGHFGFDFRATARALITNVRSGGVREGGSTITQQLARGLFLGSERTLLRKATEIPLAIGLEILLTKQQILEMYLNMVYWGQAEKGGVAGIAEAARWYFAAPIESLTVTQGALLAAIIPAPNAIAPFEHPTVALQKRNEAIEALVEAKKIDADEGARLALSPLGVRRGPPPIERFPSYTGHVTQLLDRRVRRHAAETRGLSVFTTMDLAWQTMAESGLEGGLARIEAVVGRRRPGLEGAFVALEPGTMAIRALVGGRSIGPGEFNRATQARRQTGSAIKPIVYAAALGDATVGFTPATTVPDERRVFGKGRWAWSPHNEGESYHPTVTLAFALAHSLNVATANVVEMIGPWTVAQTAQRFGLGQLKPVRSIGLGSNETTLLDLTTAYGAFLDDGLVRESTPIRAVVDGRGARLAWREAGAHDAVSPGIAALMTGLLQDVVNYGVARPLRYYGIDRPVAGKTGTTNEYQDGWFIGFTPHLVAGAWLGYDVPHSLGRAAAGTALPVWAWIVDRLIGEFPKAAFASDAEVEYRDIEPFTGDLADSGSCPAMSVPFLPGTAPTILCGWRADTLWSVWNDDSLSSADTAYVEPLPVDEMRGHEPEPEPADEDTSWHEVEPDTTGDPGRDGDRSERAGNAPRWVEARARGDAAPGIRSRDADRLRTRVAAAAGSPRSPIVLQGGRSMPVDARSRREDLDAPGRGVRAKR